MPGGFLTELERTRLDGFPATISPTDLIQFFTLSTADLAQLPRTTARHNHLGFALQLCTLRYLGFCPDDLTTMPTTVVAYVADQLGVDHAGLATYGQRDQTRTAHLQQIQTYLGFRRATPIDLQILAAWLLERALEHDKPTLLLQLACEQLQHEKIVRPGVTRLEKMVATARS